MPLRYHGLVTSTRVGLIITFTWILSILAALLPFMGWRQITNRTQGGFCQYHLNLDITYILFLHVTVCVVPITVTCAAYCKIFLVAKRQATNIASTQVGGLHDAWQLPYNSGLKWLQSRCLRLIWTLMICFCFYIDQRQRTRTTATSTGKRAQNHLDCSRCTWCFYPVLGTSEHPAACLRRVSFLHIIKRCGGDRSICHDELGM